MSVRTASQERRGSSREAGAEIGPDSSKRVMRPARPGLPLPSRTPRNDQRGGQDARSRRGRALLRGSPGYPRSRGEHRCRPGPERCQRGALPDGEPGPRGAAEPRPHHRAAPQTAGVPGPAQRGRPVPHLRPLRGSGTGCSSSGGAAGTRAMASRRIPKASPEDRASHARRADPRLPATRRCDGLSRTLLVGVVLLVLGLAIPATARRSPPPLHQAAEIEALVNRAADMLEAEGARAFDAFRRKGSTWRYGGRLPVRRRPAGDRPLQRRPIRTARATTCSTSATPTGSSSTTISSTPSRGSGPDGSTTCSRSPASRRRA